MKTIREKVENVYSIINEWNTQGRAPLIDTAFPNKDGVPDDDVISEMMLLRESLNDLIKASELGVKNLSEVIEMAEKQQYLQ